MFRAVCVVAACLIVAWLAFIAFVFAIRPDGTTSRDATRLLPDTLRLVRKLVTDRAIPRTTRWQIGLLLVYLASPVDLVPDFIPVIGYADDAIVTAFVLRHVIRTAGPDKLRQHWQGSDDGLTTLMRLTRIHEP